MPKDNLIAKYDPNAGEGAGALTAVLVGIPSIVISIGAGMPLLYELTSNSLVAFMAIPVGLLAPKWTGKGVAAHYRHSSKKQFKQAFISSLKLPDNTEPVFEDNWMKSKFIEYNRDTNTVKGHKSKSEAAPGNPLYRLKKNRLYMVKVPTPQELWDTNLLATQQHYSIPNPGTGEDR